MAIDPRDELWNAAYQSYYETYFAEIVEDALMGRWTNFDNVSRFLVAVTSGSSAIAGLAFWKDPSVAWMWPVLTSVSAVLAIASKQLGVAEKLRDHPNSRIAFSAIRIELESFRFRMRINPIFPIDPFQKELLALRKRYAEEIKRVKHDVLLTQNLRVKCQTQLNARLSEQQPSK